MNKFQEKEIKPSMDASRNLTLESIPPQNFDAVATSLVLV